MVKSREVKKRHKETKKQEEEKKTVTEEIEAKQMRGPDSAKAVLDLVATTQTWQGHAHRAASRGFYLDVGAGEWELGMLSHFPRSTSPSPSHSLSPYKLRNHLRI